MFRLRRYTHKFLSRKNRKDSAWLMRIGGGCAILSCRWWVTERYLTVAQPLPRALRFTVWVLAHQLEFYSEFIRDICISCSLHPFQVAYEWARGAPFASIMRLTTLHVSRTCPFREFTKHKNVTGMHRDGRHSSCAAASGSRGARHRV